MLKPTYTAARSVEGKSIARRKQPGDYGKPSTYLLSAEAVEKLNSAGAENL
jgi:hypothetical protein